MHKTSPTSPTKTPVKRSLTPNDLGYDAEFAREMTPAYRRSGGGVAPQQRPAGGTPRQNLSIYPGE